jgi:hypothetical protein
MIGAIHEIRDIATKLQEGSSTNDTRQPEIAETIKICDCTISHFTDDRR